MHNKILLLVIASLMGSHRLEAESSIPDHFFDSISKLMVAPSDRKAALSRLGTVNLSNDPGTRTTFSKNLYVTPERASWLIDRAYRVLLKRAPEGQGAITHWTNIYNSGGETAVVAGILSSAEFFSIQRSDNGNFIKQLYLTLLGRPASDPEVAFYLDFISKNDRPKTIQQFLVSTEYSERFSSCLFSTLLRRIPDSGATTFWSGFFRSNGLTSTVAGIFSSEEFFNISRNGIQSLGPVQCAFLGTDAPSLANPAMFTVSTVSMSQGCDPKTSGSSFRDSVLAITDLKVVNNPILVGANGPFTFGKLISEMAPPGSDASQFVSNWLDQWTTVTSVNGNPVAPRPSISRIRDNWPKVPGTSALDLSKAPMRLLAITARLDLRSITRAGEGRFVFGVLDQNGNSLPFTVIFEYTLPFESGLSQSDWALAWFSLGQEILGERLYIRKLRQIAGLFSMRRYSKLSQYTNGNAISQVRTNENTLEPLWELREFKLATDGRLRQVTVKQTPDLSFNVDAAKRSRLVSWINGNIDAVKAGNHVLPTELADKTPLLGASSLTPFNLRWLNTVAGLDPVARRSFSLNTCNGCHSGETNTVFLHVSPRQADLPASLSSFMTQPNGNLDERANDLRTLMIQSFCN